MINFLNGFASVCFNRKIKLTTPKKLFDEQEKSIEQHYWELTASHIRKRMDEVNLKKQY